MAQDLDPAPILDRIEELAADARVPVRRVSRSPPRRRRRHRRAPGRAGPRPAPARGRPRRPVPRRAPGGGQPFLLAVDGVTDPHNLGALLRSAEAAGATGAVLPRHRAVHVTPTVAKAAAGAIEHVPMAVVAGMPAALARAKELGCWVVGLAGDGEQSLFDGLPVADEAIVLVVGRRGRGPVPPGPGPLRPRGQHPDAGPAGVAQRERGRRPRALRGQPATLSDRRSADRIR